MLTDQFVDSATHLVPGIIGACYFIATLGNTSKAHRYGLVTSLLLLCSGLYHLSKAQDWTLAIQIFGRLDHIFIWIIFGLSTYFLNIMHLPLHRQKFYNGILLTLVALGIWLKSLFFESLLGWPGLSLYALIISIGSISILEMLKNHGFIVLRPYFMSILLFLLGALGERMGLIPHWVFHIAVLIGLSLFWKALRH